MLRIIEQPHDKTSVKAADNRPAYREVAKDFKQLQLKNYSLYDVTQPDKPLDYARIRKDTVEIRKHALRLRSYLSLPEPDKSPKQNQGGDILTPEGMRKAAASLNMLVKNFVSNPVFQQPGVVNVDQLAKAKRDVAVIISLSERIMAGAEALSKGVGKKS